MSWILPWNAKICCCHFFAALTLLCDPANTPALVNCAHGKDRTGVVCALLQGCLGASPQQIMEDYAQSEVWWAAMGHQGHQLLKLAWKLLSQISFKSPRGRWVNIPPIVPPCTVLDEFWCVLPLWQAVPRLSCIAITDIWTNYMYQ